FVNNSGGWLHPIRPHLVEYMVLSRAGGVGRRAYETGALKDIVSLGPNETVHVLIKPVPNDSGGTRIVTDGVTTSGTTTVTSATANFTQADVGARIAGAGIPIGARIASWQSRTTVVTSLD